MQSNAIKDRKRRDFLQKLKANDVAGDVPSISEETANLLHLLVRMKKAKSLLEIGTAHAYSTIWLADALGQDGQLMSFDVSAPSFAVAEQNIAIAQVNHIVSLHFGNALEIIPQQCQGKRFDIVFVDARKKHYLDFWQVIQPYLKPDSLIVFDDVLKFPQKTKPFLDHIENQTQWQYSIIPTDGDDGMMLLQRIESID